MTRWKRVPCYLVLTATCLLFAGFWVGASHADQVAELLAIADNIQNQTPGIGFQVWTEGDRTAYQVADQVAFGFTSDRDCYLCMINIGTTGKTTILFPNKWHPNNKIEGGKTYRIPPEGSDYAFKFMGPEGTERIKVIASLEPVLANVQSLQEELRTPVEQGQPGGTFLNIKNPGLVLKDIGFVLGGTEPAKWAAVDLFLEVTPAGPGQQPGSFPQDQQQPGAGPQPPQQ